MTADPDPERALHDTPADRQAIAELVHGLANHVGALLLGIDLLHGEDDLPDHATETLDALLGEVRSAAALLADLQELAPSPDQPRPDAG